MRHRWLRRGSSLEPRVVEVAFGHGINGDKLYGLRRRELQELLADTPPEGLRLMRREWPTDIGPVDLMCRDENDEFVAVEIKRIGTIDAVEQLTRYLERISEEPGLHRCRGVLAAQAIKPQARILAESRGIECVEVDVEVLKGTREPALTLFA